MEVLIHKVKFSFMSVFLYHFLIKTMELFSKSDKLTI